MQIKNKLDTLQKNLNRNAKEMAEILDITKAYYSMIYNGKRKPSSKVVAKLSELSNKPISYWNGELDKYLEEAIPFEQLNKIVKALIDGNFIENATDILSNEYDSLIRKALVIDVEHQLILKKEKEQQ